MTSLKELQQRVATLVMQPLTREENMRRRTTTGHSVKAAAEKLIKPNKYLGSFERLEIYNRQYWFRVFSCFMEDFPGLRALVGREQFERLMQAYLTECPSESFTLRNLGSRLEQWLLSNLEWITPSESLLLDMVRLEWAHIEAFDAGQNAPLTPGEIATAGLTLRVSLQPYVQLLALSHAVDDLLIEIHEQESWTNTLSNAAQQRRLSSRMRRHAEPEPKPIYLAVHRINDSVYYKRLPGGAFRMLQALRERETLEQCIDIAIENSTEPRQEQLMDIREWFANWAELGWFCSSVRREI